MRAARASYLTVLRESAFFPSRDPPGRRRARVAPAIKDHSLAPADPVGERARDAVFVQPFNTKRKTAHGARDAPLGNLAAPRQKAGKDTPKRRMRVFHFTKRARVFSCAITCFLHSDAGRCFFPRRAFHVPLIQIQRNRFFRSTAGPENKNVVRRKC